MKQFNRRTFLKLAGGGSAAAAAAALPGAAVLAPWGTKQLSFRASTGLPAKPLPSMATTVLEGHIDLDRGTGMVTSSVFAGHPMPSQIALPGLTRVIRITEAEQRGAQVLAQGVVDDRSQLQRGESPLVQLVIDQGNRTVTSPLLGQLVTLGME